MVETNRVVARFTDGTMVKGTTEDFFPNRPMFHLHVSGDPKVQVVSCAKLKAVFFVKDLAGNPQRDEVVDFTGEEVGVHQGRRIAVQFKDGEMIAGHTVGYTSERSGFFITPSDPQSNNLRIYVLKHSTHKIAVGDPATAMVRAARGDAA
ncbi:MAG: hypothetical protein ABIU54_12610 [Candidatus Eisenbacteria bacterium]